MTQSIDILSIDAKDIYISNHYIEEQSSGYSIKAKDGSLVLSKFKNSFDDSLELMELRKIYEKVYRNTKFSFFSKHEYSTQVINVTFEYAIKEFNELSKNVYVKFGYKLEDLEFNDGIAYNCGEIVGVQTNVLVSNVVPDMEKCPQLYYNAEKNIYQIKKNYTTHSTSDLRKILYKDGFVCDGVKYVRYKRSSGSSRVGTCLFINEKMYSRILTYSKFGLPLREGQPIDLASWESYISLTMSSIIGTIRIEPKNILVIDDWESEFYDDVINTTIGKDNKLKTKEDRCKISNAIWDGMSIGDESLYTDYPNVCMLLLRKNFFKSACFKGRLQKFFQDNNITDVSQLNGFTLAKKIEDVKLITTPSSIKYLKFGTLEQWLENVDSIFGVVKHEKPTKFFGGELVQTHYQLLNTLQLSEKEVETLLEPTFDYLYHLKTDPAFVRFHIKYPDSVEFKPTPLESKNDIIYKMLGLNPAVANTKYYIDFKKDLIKSFTKNLRKGHVMVEGNYSTLCGNPIEMLKYAIGKFNGESIMKPETIHSIKFQHGEEILGSRSPHVTMGNVWLAENVLYEEIIRYMCLTKEIVVVNSINENLLNRLSGCDFDSDTALLTNNKILKDSARKNYHLFKVPVNSIKSSKRKRYYTAEQQADLDVKTSVNKIGEIINLSQELNTIFWDKYNNGTSFEELKELYYDVCQLDVLSGIEIDRAKKEFTVNTTSELKHLRKKWLSESKDGRAVKPNFFGHLHRDKGYYNSKTKNYAFHDTTMDYLQRAVNRFSYRTRITENVQPLSSVFDGSHVDTTQVDYRQIQRILDLCECSRTKVQQLYLDTEMDSKCRYEKICEIKQESVEYIGKIKLNYSTMYQLIVTCEKKENSAIYRTVINTLFGYPNTDFFNLMQTSKEKLPVITACEDGEIVIFDRNHTKIG